jgi:hypothetical protein
MSGGFADVADPRYDAAGLEPEAERRLSVFASRADNTRKGRRLMDREVPAASSFALQKSVAPTITLPGSAVPPIAQRCALKEGSTGCSGIAAPSVRGSEPAKLTPLLASRMTASPLPITPEKPPIGVMM